MYLESDYDILQLSSRKLITKITLNQKVKNTGTWQLCHWDIVNFLIIKLE